MVDQAHPDYLHGFFEALDGASARLDASPEYQEGWNAAHRSKRILEDAGFKKTGREFSAGCTVPNGGGRE